MNNINYERYMFVVSKILIVPDHFLNYRSHVKLSEWGVLLIAELVDIDYEKIR